MNYKITDLKQIGKSERYKLFLDFAYRCDLELEIIYKYHLKDGVILSEEELNEILFENKKLTCFSVALKYVSKSLKTEKQVRDYLLKNEYPLELVDLAVKKLAEYKYIDDAAYAKSYFNTYSQTKGIKLIKNELKNKGIKNEILQEVFEDVSDNIDVISKIVQKKLKNCVVFDQKQKEKLIRSLISKGYDYSDIKRVLSDYKIESPEDDY